MIVININIIITIIITINNIVIIISIINNNNIVYFTLGVPWKSFLVVCFGWPIACSSYRGYVRLNYRLEDEMFVDVLTCVTWGIAELMWGCYVYLIYATRLSFQIQFDLILRYLKNNEGRTELCLNVLRQVVVDYRCFLDCISMYMSVWIPLCVLEVTSNLIWQYRLAGDQDEREIIASSNAKFCMRISMFVTLPLIALGNVHSTNLWEKFQERVHCVKGNNGRNDYFWESITKYLKRVDQKSSGVSLTVMLSILGFYIALVLGNQDVELL